MRYACLLRGISPMNAPSAKLRTVFENLHFDNVQTVISSGNVVFDSDEPDGALLEKQIEAQLQADLGLRSAAIIRSAEQIRGLVQAAPFGDQIHSRESYLTVTFLKRAPAARPEPDVLAGGAVKIIGYNAENRALCAITNPSLTKTPDFMSQLERKFGKDITTRTWNTVIKIHQKM